MKTLEAVLPFSQSHHSSGTGAPNSQVGRVATTCARRCLSRRHRLHPWRWPDQSASLAWLARVLYVTMCRSAFCSIILHGPHFSATTLPGRTPCRHETALWNVIAESLKAIGAPAARTRR